MPTVGRSPDISVMWRMEYYAGAGYIRHVRHVAVKGLLGLCYRLLQWLNVVIVIE